MREQHADQQQHYGVGPGFSSLPAPLVDHILGPLSSSATRAACSLVCRAWRRLPLLYLTQLTVNDTSQAALPSPDLLQLW